MPIVVGIVDKATRITKKASHYTKNGVNTIKAVPGVDYVLVDQKTDAAPQKIITVRDGNNLKLFLFGEEDPSVVIEDYYLIPGYIIGETAGKQVHDYTPESQAAHDNISAMADKQAAVQQESDKILAPITWEHSGVDWELLGFLGLAVGGITAGLIAHHNKNKDSGHDSDGTVPPIKTTVVVDIPEKPAPGANPVLSGKLSAALSDGQEVVVYRDGKAAGKATVKSDGSWTFEDTSGQFTDGKTYQYTARVEGNGQAGPESAGQTITWTADPNVPDITTETTITGVTEIPDPAHPKENRPVLNGKLSQSLTAGQDVVIYRDGKAVGKATVKGDGSWSFADNNSAFKDGASYHYTARVEGNGKAGPESAGLDYTWHAPVVDPDITNVATVTGISEAANPSDPKEKRPVLNGKLSQSLTSGQEVVIYRDGKAVGKATVKGDGSWSFADNNSAFKDGTSYHYTARVEGNGKTGPESAGLDYTWHMPEPDITNVATVTGITETGGTSDPKDKRPVLNGKLSESLQSNQDVTIYRDGRPIGKATVKADGSWSFTDSDSAFTNGASYHYTARVEGYGKAGPESGGMNYTWNTTVVDPDITNVATVTGITEAASPSEPKEKRPVLNGKLSQSLTSGQEVVIYRDGKAVGKATVKGDGSWSFADNSSAFKDGASYHYTARVEGNGKAGPESAGLDYTWHAPVVDPDITTVTTISGIGETISPSNPKESRPVLSGKLSHSLTAGQEVVVYRDGKAVGKATVKSDDSWWFTDENSQFRDGSSYHYTARVEGNGKTGPESAGQDYTWHAPVVDPGITNVATINGITEAASPSSPKEKRPVLNGKLSQSLTSGQEVVIYRDGKAVGKATVKGDGSWSFADNNSAFKDGASYHYTARVEGNGKAGPESVGQDYTWHAPVVDPGITNVATINGITEAASPSSPKEKRPVLNGKLSQSLTSGQEVVIYRDGKAVGKATVKGDGSWSFADNNSAFKDGVSYHYTARVEGNGKTGPESAGLDYTWHAPVVDPDITNVATINGVGEVASPSSPKEKRPALNGKLSESLTSGQEVVIYRDGKVVGKATVKGDGSWSFTDNNSPFSDGSTYHYTARVEGNGKTGPESAGQDYTWHAPAVDPGIPTEATITVVMDGANPSKPQESRPVVQGKLSQSLTAGQEVTVYRDGKAAGKATVNADGTWEFADTGSLSKGQVYIYSARVTGGGKEGPLSAGQSHHFSPEIPDPMDAITTKSDITSIVMPGQPGGSAKPILTGKILSPLKMGEYVVVYRDGLPQGQAKMEAGNTWTFTDSGNGLNKGETYTYTTMVYSISGKKGPESAGYKATIPDNLKMMSLMSDYADDHGAHDTTVITAKASVSSVQAGKAWDPAHPDDATPLLGGQTDQLLAADQFLMIFRDGIKIGEVTPDSHGQWSFEDITGGFTDGASYHYTVCVASEAGNTGDMSDAFNVRYDLPAETDTPAADDAADALPDAAVTDGTATDTVPAEDSAAATDADNDVSAPDQYPDPDLTALLNLTAGTETAENSVPALPSGLLSDAPSVTDQLLQMFAPETDEQPVSAEPVQMVSQPVTDMAAYDMVMLPHDLVSETTLNQF